MSPRRRTEGKRILHLDLQSIDPGPDGATVLTLAGWRTTVTVTTQDKALMHAIIDAKDNWLIAHPPARDTRSHIAETYDPHNAANAQPQNNTTATPRPRHDPDHYMTTGAMLLE
jgi:hypothetical protein